MQQEIQRLVLFALATLAGLGFAGIASGKVRVFDVADAALVQREQVLMERVEYLLRTDVGLAGSRFRVTLRGNVVLLGGAVPDESSQRRALSLVAAIPGVREVRNHLVIDPLAWRDEGS